MVENWKEIIGYNGVYYVSSLGRVKSVDHYPKGRTGKQTGRVLKLIKSYKGYLQVSLSFNKKRFNTGAHRLVAAAFIDNPQNKPQVNHINGIKDDNRVVNLEWVTQSENTKHAYKNNLVNLNYGENHHFSKLTNLKANEIRKEIKLGKKIKEIAKENNTSYQTIWKIKNNITYTK